MRPLLVRNFFFALISVLLLSGCSSLLYYPTSYMYVDKEKLEYKPREVNFEGPDKLKITGWYFRSHAEKPKAVILFFHGNAQNISSHFISLYWILKHDYDFFIFDYPGYGGSEGEPNPKNTVETGKKAMTWLRGLIAPDVPLVVFGQSLGGNVAMRTVADMKNELQPCLVAIDASFASYKKAGQRALKSNPWTWAFQYISYLALSDRDAATGHIANISPLPLLVIHGDGDRVLDFANSEDIFKEAKEPKEFWTVPGGGHGDVFTSSSHGEKYQKMFLDRLKRCQVPFPDAPPRGSAVFTNTYFR